MSGAAAASTLRDADVGGWSPPQRPSYALVCLHFPPVSCSKLEHQGQAKTHGILLHQRLLSATKTRGLLERKGSLTAAVCHSPRAIWRLWRRFLLLACTTPPPFLFGYTTQCLKRSKRPLRPCLDKSGPIRQGSAGFQLTIQHWCTVFPSGIQKVRTGELFSYVSTSHYLLLLQKYYSDQSQSPASESGFKSHTHSCLVQNPC